MAAPKWVLLLGEFSSGKSAFINMLLGAAILPERLASTDLPVVKVSSRLTPGISLTYADKPRKALARWDQIPSDWRLFDYAEVTLSGHPLLDTGLVLWDTPGINATLPRHREHLERFLTDRAGGFHRVLYFVPNNISRTSLDFLQSWRALWPNLMIVVNVKESLPREACEALSREARKIVMRELGNIPVLTLAVGDACEAFVEACHKVTDNRSDGDRIRNWHTGQIDFGELLGLHADHIVGDELFEIVAETTPSPTALFDPAELSDARLKALADNGDPSALLLYSEQLLKSGPGSTDLPYIKQAAMLDDPAAQLALGQALLEGQPGRKNVALAVKWLWEAAEQKSAKAQYLLGSCHEQGRGVPADMPTAIQWYRHAAEGGVPDAQHRLGQLYERGDGLPRDAGVAASWYQRASDQNHHGAQWAMGRLYESGEGVEQNLKQAVTCYDRAASGGYADAQYRLAQILLEGKLVRRNATRALPLLQAAAEQGLASAQFDLARSLEQGIGTQPDQAAAVRWYQAAAEQGHPEAQFYLAECYEAGVGIKQNIKEAMRWYQAASGQNHLESKFNLGRLLEQHGRSASALAEAAALYQTAAEQGHVDAQLRLAVFYAEGIGVGADSAKAVIWFRRAAETGCAEAQYRLAESLARGNGVARDDGEALRWNQRSADLGYAPAHYELGLRYHAGNGLPKDKARAAAHLRIAADAGIVNAQLWLGALLETSGGTAAEQAEAEQYYRRAAEQGLAEAQCRLATLLERNGGGRAEKEVSNWYTQAAQQDHREAQFALARLYEEGRGKLKQSYDEAARWYQRAAENGMPGALEALVKASQKKQQRDQAEAEARAAKTASEEKRKNEQRAIAQQRIENERRQAELDRRWATFQENRRVITRRGQILTFFLTLCIYVGCATIYFLINQQSFTCLLIGLLPVVALFAVLTCEIFKAFFGKKLDRLARRGDIHSVTDSQYAAEVFYSIAIGSLPILLMGILLLMFTVYPLKNRSSSNPSDVQPPIVNSPVPSDEGSGESVHHSPEAVSFTPTSGPMGETYRETSTGMMFVKIPAGSFSMGDEKGADSDKPVHLVTISRPFFLQITEVTQGQWAAVMGNTPAYFQGEDQYPVETISWDEVQEFLRKINEKDPGKRYRLPTEAEWEYACRAGNPGERPEDLTTIAWYKANSLNRTHPVGQKQANPWGIYDMLGNVWEWCSDWHDPGYYSVSPSSDPPGPAEGQFRVLRGGSWFSNEMEVSITHRGKFTPEKADRDTGFRCVIEALTAGEDGEQPASAIQEQTVVENTRRQSEEDWTAAIRSDIPEAYRAFIDKYNRIPLAATRVQQARDRLRQLDLQLQSQNTRRADIERAWARARQQDTRDSYSRFLTEYSSDALASDQVKQALKRLQELGRQVASASPQQPVESSRIPPQDSATTGRDDPDHLARQAVQYFWTNDLELFQDSATRCLRAGGTISLEIKHHHPFPLTLHTSTIKLTDRYFFYDPGLEKCSSQAFGVPLQSIKSLALKGEPPTEVLLEMKLADPKNPKKTKTMNFAHMSTMLEGTVKRGLLGAARVDEMRTSSQMQADLLAIGQLIGWAVRNLQSGGNVSGGAISDGRNNSALDSSAVGALPPVGQEAVDNSGQRSNSYGHFIDNGDGTVTDTTTGLMWTKSDSRAMAGPNSLGLTWEAAMDWVRRLNMGGHRDWRMPTIRELQTIYDPNSAVRSWHPVNNRPLRLSPVFAAGGAQYYWSRESPDSGAHSYLDFMTGDIKYYRGSRMQMVQFGVRGVRRAK